MNYEILANIPLFDYISESEILKLTECMSASRKAYRKGDIIFLNGNILDVIGIVISGSVLISATDITDNVCVMSVVKAGDIFGENYSLLPKTPLAVDITANENCDIIFLRTDKLFNPCSKACNSHSIFLKNLIISAARKNIALTNRMCDISPKSIRGRVMSYLTRETEKCNSKTITIPFNRLQLAEYLNLDRSALSKELSRMKADGLINYSKNKFTVKF